MPLRSKFLTLFQRSGLAYADLAKRSGVSAATISRIVNGSSGSAENLEALIEALTEYDDEAPAVSHCDMCRASMQRAFDQRFEDQRTHYEDRIALIKEHAAERIKEKDADIAALKKYQDRLIMRNRIMLAVLIILCSAVVILSIVDLTHGGHGWFRYFAGVADYDIFHGLKY